MKIGNQIKKVRELRNLTQEYVADRLGLSQQNYSKIERNEVDIPYSRLEQIAKILSVEVKDIVSFDEKVVFYTSQTDIKDFKDNSSNIGVNYNQDYANEIKNIYESQIVFLRQEITDLKAIIQKILEK